MLASILINSNKKENLEILFDSYEKNSFDLASFEIIINVDKNDKIIKEYLIEQIKIRKFKIKFIQEYEGDYFDGHKNNNLMLNYINPNAYFLSCTGDRVLIETKNWDKILADNTKIFEDDIYRVKISNSRNRKYFDYWECCFAPENVFFITKKFIDISGDFSPCFSHDSFIQCIFYYLERHDNFNSKQINRDLILNGIHCVGNKPEKKKGDDEYMRLSGQVKAWNILTSYHMQKEAFRRAMLIKANILTNKFNNFSIYEKNNKIYIENNETNERKAYSYNLSFIKIYFTNFFRKLSYLNYCGGGMLEKPNKIIFSIVWYLNYRYKILRGIKDFYNKYFE